jgi:F0F1-type ATP synthase assembly protein I
MPARRYRLASPTDNDKTTILYPPIILIRSTTRPRSVMSHNNALSEKRPVFSVDEDKNENENENEKSIETVLPSRWWLVLPCLLIMIFVSAAEPLLLNDFIVRRYKRQYGLDTSSSAQHTACRQPTTTTPMPMFYADFFQPDQPQPQVYPDYNLVEQAASKFNVKNSIATLVPALVTFILFGSNCDMIGRRPLLLIPFLGKIVRYSLMLVIISRDLSDTWLIATHALDAAFGSQGLLMLSAFAYITDCTLASTRTRAFLLTEVIGVVVRIVSMLILGLWLHRYLYIVPISVYLALSVIGLLYVLFVQNESIESV